MEIERVNISDLRFDVLPARSRKAFLCCTKLPMLSRSGWYLAGGTALALQVGHRRSVDLDFFIAKGKFRELNVERVLHATGQWKTSFRERGTIYGSLVKGKVSLIAYPFFQPSSRRIACGHVRMLIPEDVASMKIVAISQRGKKRDFVDLYWYAHNCESLADVVRRAVRQYPGQEHNLPHILKSLTYFDDADMDPMPTLYFKASWKTIKAYFRREVPKITKELLGMK